jgi:hypothetical protein
MQPSHLPIEQGFRVRLMSHLGSYPARSFLSEFASLVVSPEICFSIVRVQQRDWSWGELDCMIESELPLFGSVVLTGNAGATYLYPYPTSCSVSLETATVKNIDDECVRECKSFLLNRIQKYAEDAIVASFHKPPILGGEPYKFIEADDYGDWSLTLRSLKSASPVILRGVNCLIKSRMAFQHRELGESACLHLWIALDAAHSLILQKLREDGNANPTSVDAARYFEKMSGLGTEWDRFFEEDYDNRIRVNHPDNRFGAEAIPSLMAEDFFDLYGALVPLFRFFVSERLS